MIYYVKRIDHCYTVVLKCSISLLVERPNLIVQNCLAYYRCLAFLAPNVHNDGPQSLQQQKQSQILLVFHFPCLNSS